MRVRAETAVEPGQWAVAQTEHRRGPTGSQPLIARGEQRGSVIRSRTSSSTTTGFRPGRLRRWHPGFGVVPLGQDAPHHGERWYSTSLSEGRPIVALDVAAFLADRGGTVAYVQNLLAATASRPAQTGCPRPARVGDGLPAGRPAAQARPPAAAGPGRNGRGRRLAPRSAARTSTRSGSSPRRRGR